MLLAQLGGIELGEELVETVVLAQDTADRRLVAGEQGQHREMHLARQGLLDLLCPGHALVCLVELLAVLRGLEKGTHAEARHGDEEQRDHQERRHQLGVERRGNAGDPADQRTHGGAGEHDCGERLELDFGLLREGVGRR